MRLSVSAALLLIAGTAAGGAALVNCSAAEEEPALSDEEINGANNAMGLRLVYDEATGRVNATVRSRIRATDKLVLRVRRGRLSMDSQRELDCSELPEAPHLAPREDAPTKFVYQGPEVDRSLLASVYTQEWIDGNITPQMIERLSREGADAIVEACILRDGAARARLQTSLQYAWDQADPNLSSGIGERSLRPLGADAGAGEDGGEEGDGGAPRPVRAGNPIRSMEKYAELCVRELGEIPFFKKLGPGKYETFDCRDFTGSSGPIDGVEGAMIPTSVSDDNGRENTPNECNDRRVNRYNCYDKCDKPEWLFQSCEPGPTVSTAKNDKGTHWTLLCRSTQSEGEETAESLKKTKRFNDIAMIGHNPITGKTCFFQNKIFSGTDGARVTHPADLEKSRHVWDEPKGYCMGCHSAEAFIHTPWIDGAIRRDGTPIVPKMGAHADFEISWNGSPYSVVNRKAQARGRVGGGSWDMPKQIVSEEADACLSCHRIGAGQGMRRFPMWAVGEEGLDKFPSGTSGPLEPKLTNWAKRFENSHWMPPRLSGITEETWPQSKYAKAVAHIRKCAENAAAEGCLFEDIPEAP
ncbi:MAG: hypothetical protein KF819_17195 [Labilithrix sp.]|nr:hypothetical protein [Labilithrix sp.]